MTRLVLILLMVAASALPVGAQTPLSTDQRAQVDRVELYLKSVSTVEADFIQVSDQGVADGKFWLWRPGLLRFEYANPRPDFIVADGSFIFYWDSLLEQQSHALISSTMAHFLLREDISLYDPDIRITRIDNRDGLLRMTLTQAEDPGAGSITLVFNALPLQLRQWSVVDAQGTNTEVTLQNARFGVPLDRDMFYFREPRNEWGD